MANDKLDFKQVLKQYYADNKTTLDSLIFPHSSQNVVHQYKRTLENIQYQKKYMYEYGDMTIASWLQDHNQSEEIRTLLTDMSEDYKLLVICLMINDETLEKIANRIDTTGENINASNIQEKVIKPFLIEEQKKIRDEFQTLGSQDEHSRDRSLLNTFCAFISLITSPLSLFTLLILHTGDNKKERGSSFMFYADAPKQAIQPFIEKIDELIKDKLTKIEDAARQKTDQNNTFSHK